MEDPAFNSIEQASIAFFNNLGYHPGEGSDGQLMTEKLVQFIHGTLYGNETAQNEPYFD